MKAFKVNRDEYLQARDGGVRSRTRARVKAWRINHPAQSCSRATRTKQPEWKLFRNFVKWLSVHPERSMFPGFAAIDDHAEWIENMPSDSLDASQILQIKETLVT